MGRLIIVVFIFVFVGCSQKEKVVEFEVFHYNQPNPITSLDPAFAKSQNNIWAINHVFNGLVQLDDSLNLKPCLARSWDISDDGLVYTFHLRQDVLFHEHELFQTESERLFDADDVVYSFNRLISEDLYAAGSWVFVGKVDKETPFTALNDSTFQMRLKEPFIPMLNILSMQYCSILPKETAAWDPQFVSRNPIGTGPFQFKRWIENQGLYLVKNDDYFEFKDGVRLPYLDGVKSSFIADKKIAFLELINGKLDAVSGLESSFINELLDQEGNLLDKQKDKIALYKNPYLNFEYLGINLNAFDESHPIQDRRVRQALNYAIDRNTMLGSVRNNIGKAADGGVIPRGLPTYHPDSLNGYYFDLEKAAQLLAESGYPGGRGIDALNIHTNQDYLDLTTIVAKQWEKLGLTVNIKLMESAALRESMRKGDLGIFRASWIADYPDEESFLCMFYSSNPAPPNYTRYQSESFDERYRYAISESDLQKRMHAYLQMDSMLLEDAPVIYLFYDEVALFTSKDLKGVSRNALNLLQVKELYEE